MKQPTTEQNFGKDERKERGADDNISNLLSEAGTLRITDELESLEHAIAECKNSIDVLKHFPSLLCDGRMPEISVDDDILRRLVFLALSNITLNTLPDNDPLSYVNISARWKEFLGEPVIKVKAALKEMLQARNYKLSEEVIGFASHTKLNLLYNTVGDFRIRLDEMNEALDAYENSAALKARVEEIKRLISKFLRDMDKDIRDSYIRTIRGFLNNLQNLPDDNLGITPAERLKRIFQILRRYDGHLLDLRGLDLKEVGMALKELDISGVNLKLTLEQEDMYLSQEQRFERNGKIFKAAKSGDVAGLERFHSSGLNIDCADSAGRTPLMTACMASQVDAVRFLLKERANPAARTVNGWAVLEGVMMLESSEQVTLIAQLLIKHGAVQTLHSLAAFGDLRNAKIIISAAQINELIHGIAPIHIAVKANKPDNVEWLCENGAQIELQDIEKRSPLRIACEYGAENMALLLVSKGAGIDKASSIDVARQRGHFILAVTLEREKKLQEIKALQSRLRSLREKQDFLQGKQAEVHQEVGNIGNIGLLDFAKRSMRDDLQEQSRRHSVEESRVTSQMNDITRKISVLQEEERKLSKQLDTLIRERPGELRREAEELVREAEELEERILKLRRDAKNKIEEANRLEREHDAQRMSRENGQSPVRHTIDILGSISSSSSRSCAATTTVVSHSSSSTSSNAIGSMERGMLGSSSLQACIPSSTATTTVVSHSSSVSSDAIGSMGRSTPRQR